MIDGKKTSGARFNKYPPGRQSEAKYWSNDWILYRLTDIYFHKAEALMQKNGGTATPETLELINAVRKRPSPRLITALYRRYPDISRVTGRAWP